MAIEKKASFTSERPVWVLNVPQGHDWDIFNKKSLNKYASVRKDKALDLGGFDIKAAVDQNPDHLFVKVFAIKKDEVNDNGDAFSEKELMAAAPTFIGCPVFCNHQNDDVEKARGKVVHAWYDNKDGGIYTINMVDKIAYPKLARGIEEGYITGTSMGCSVEYSLCSACHNKAHTANEYCSHVANGKNRKVSGKFKNAYHDSPSKPMDPDPITGKTASQEEIFNHDGMKVFEWNFGIKFIEDSFVVNPACHSCIVHDILNASEFHNKVASLQGRVEKIAHDMECNDGCSLEKTAGQQELMMLNSAMDQLENVSKSMMAQKMQVSMDYVSDLVKTLADIQNITDELTEMGYGQLQSPSSDQVNAQTVLPTDEGMMNAGQPQFPAPEQPQQPVAPPAPQSSETSSGQLGGGLGTVTKPKLSSNDVENKKEFVEKLANLSVRIDSLKKYVESSYDEKQINLSEKTEQESNVMGKSTEKIASQEKVAEHSTDVITEKQLNEKDNPYDGAGVRWNDHPEVITEKQLDNPTANANPQVTTTDSPQNRKGSYEFITEKQLAHITDGYVTRWNSFPEVITEKQWTDISRLVGSELANDQSDRITEKQLQDFLSHHSYDAWDVITEKQLPQEPGDITERWASVAHDSKSLVKAAMESVADTIAFYNKTPDEVKKAASKLVDSVETKGKATALTLINALPSKKAHLDAEKQRYRYFSKVAGAQDTPNTVDCLVASMADNLGKLSASDLVEAVNFVVKNEKALKKVEAMINDKVNSEIKIAKHVDKQASFGEAFADLNRESDGLYQIEAQIDEINADINNKKAFVLATEDFAQQKVSEDVGSEVKVALMKLDVNQKDGFLVATVKELDKLDDEEKKAYASRTFDTVKKANTKEEKKETLETRANKRNNVVKEAQFGGPAGNMDGAGQVPSQQMPAPAGPAPEMGGLESLEGGEMGGDDVLDGGEALEPLPPGSVCPVCTSDDVNIVDGAGHCNNCGSDFRYKVLIEVTNFAGVSPVEEGGEDEDDVLAGEGTDLEGGAEPGAPLGNEDAAGMGAGMGGMGAGMPAAASTDNNSMKKVAGWASMTKLTPESLKKAYAGGVKELGSVSPLSGTMNTVKMAKNEWLCLDTGVKYKVEFGAKGKNVYAQWSWDPTVITAECDSCNRGRKLFASALQAHGLNDDKFETLSWNDKAKKIVEMKKAGRFAAIKTASKENTASVLDTMKKLAGGGIGDKFPVEECREIIARRYGENAIALSGPFEGEKLVDAVAKALKASDVYSNKLAVKLAGYWNIQSGCAECTEDLIKKAGFNFSDAKFACDMLEKRYARPLDKIAFAVEKAAMDYMEGHDSSMMDSVPMEDDLDDPEIVFEDDLDPGVSIDEGGTITLNLPVDVLDQFETAIDEAKGEDPGMEEHHDLGDEVADMEVDVEVPGDVVEGVEDAAEDVLDEVVDGGDDDPEGGPDGPGGLPIEEGVEEEVEVPSEGEIVDVVEDETQEMGGPGCSMDSDKPMEGPEGGAVESGEESHMMEGGEESHMMEGGEKDNSYMKGYMDAKEGKPMMAKSDKNTKEAEQKEGEIVENQNKDDNADNSKEAQVENESRHMKPGHISSTGEINLDLSGVLAAINKKADKLKFEPAQDVAARKDANPSGKAAIGDEDEFSADDPKGHSGKATMAQEPTDLQSFEDVDVNTGNAVMGDEAGSDLGSEDTDTATGGDGGQGASVANKAASTKDRISALADGILNQQKKADKVNRKPAQDDPDVGEGTAGKDSFMGNEHESIGDVPAAEVVPAGIPEGSGNENMIGHEEESIGDKPKTTDTPEIPTNDDRIKGEKDNDKIKPEKDDTMTGYVANLGATASSGGQTKVAENAVKLAGLLVKMNKITVDELPSKIAEFSGYSQAALAELEKAYISPSKGLNAPADGLEGAPVVVDQDKTRTAQSELSTKLQSLFVLSNRADEAEKTNADLYKTYGR